MLIFKHFNKKAAIQCNYSQLETIVELDEFHGYILYLFVNYTHLLHLNMQVFTSLKSNSLSILKSISKYLPSIALIRIILFKR